jgi:16S rRNA (cytosine967-C5)-methyltransferase
MPAEDRIILGWALCSSVDELQVQYPAEWIERARQLGEENFKWNEIFPWQEELSSGIDYQEFCQSFLVQPRLFLRIRPGREQIVLSKLENAGISFVQPEPLCIAVPNGVPVEKIIELNKDAVIQDYNSQATGRLLAHMETGSTEKKLSVWDCCAASGGKSIMAIDLLGDIELTVTDIRESILVNLKKRFSEAGIRHYRSFTADLVQSVPNSLSSSSFRLIIADIPCTGSGTWGRTPEQLFYFNKDSLVEYAARQKKIISHVIPQMEKQAYLLYITCSVFKKENEDMVEWMKKNYSLEAVKMELLKGYDKKADTMFAVLMRAL